MSVDAHTNATGTDMPGDAESLTDATPVLLQRQLVPGTDTSTLSRFGQNRWHVNEGIFEEDAAPYSFSFTAIPAPFRQLAKHYLWQVINHDAPSSMRRAAVERPSLRTIANMWTPLTLFLKWLHTRGITEMDHVTAELLDDYLIEVGAEDITLERKHRRITEVRRLWMYRSLLPEPMRLPAMPPWGGDAARELLGNVKTRGENLTPRIGEDTMDALLWWSLRFVEDFASDILAAHREYLFLHLRSPRARRTRGPTPTPPKVRTIKRSRSTLTVFGAKTVHCQASSSPTDGSASTGATSGSFWTVPLMDGRPTVGPPGSCSTRVCLSPTTPTWTPRSSLSSTAHPGMRDPSRITKHDSWHGT